MNLQYSQTTKYDQFKTIRGNRMVNPERVQDLKKSIKVNNKLNVNPIIVDQDLYVMDGQHRLKAAEELKLPIYYIIDKNCDYGDMVLLNTHRKNWSMFDYLYYHYQGGNKEYEFMYELWNMAKNYYSPFSAFYIVLKSFNGEGYSDFSGSFKDGSFKVQNKALTERFIKESFPKMKEINALLGKLPEKISKTLFFKTSYVHVLCLLFKNMNKTEYAELWRCVMRDYHHYRDAGSSQVLRMFDQSYNFKKHAKMFDFTEFKKNYYRDCED